MGIKDKLTGMFSGGANESDGAGTDGGAGSGAIRSLESLADLDEALAASSDRAVVLFKHSTRCPVSFHADDVYRGFVEGFAGREGDTGGAGPLFTHLNLIRHRDVSNAIAERLGVMHQSPQAIVVKGGKAVWDASHGDITAEGLGEAIS